MKRSFLFIFLFGALFTAPYFSLIAQTADLTIQISGIDVLKGKMQVGIYDNSNDFLIEDKELIVLSLDADSSTLVHTVSELPFGHYSIAFYHDENSDGKCNRNWIGIPTESYGFSNNVKIRFSAPTFEKTRFSVQENTEILLSLNSK